MNKYNVSLIKRMANDLFNCSKMMVNPIQAYGYLRSGKKPDIGVFKMGSSLFHARKEDWVAIREVLVEDEYSCIDDLFGTDDKPVVFDLGANIGSFALRMFKRCKNSKVVSVEAAEDTFSILLNNRTLNPLFDWEVFNFGVWNTDGPLTLMRRGLSVGHRVIEGVGEDAVQGITLKTLLEKMGCDKIDLIKMDIEGGEEMVIPNAIDILRSTRFLIIEVHNDRIDATPVLNVLRSVYSHYWQLNNRKSTKPLYLMTNELLDVKAFALKV